MAIALAVVFALPGISNAASKKNDSTTSVASTSPLLKAESSTSDSTTTTEAPGGETSVTLAQISSKIGADVLHAKGITGAGVTVAVIDTGVADVPGLSGDKVIYGPDLSFEASVEDLYNRDSFGHGTIMASIIAGSDDDPNGFQGIAPGARILAVKVADNTGAVDVTQVIAAIDFVIQTKDDSGVRVINLSYRTDGGQDPLTDPLVAAVERAWDAGIVVVVSAGNDGNRSNGLGNPSLSPFVIAVGATIEPELQLKYSSTGDRVRTPDITAPGHHVLALGVPGSRLAQENSGAFIDERYLRGSGTSQAAAIVSGAAALLFEQRPELSPDQMKGLLMASANDPIHLEKAAKSGTLIYTLLDPTDRLDPQYKDGSVSDDASILELVSKTWTGSFFAQDSLSNSDGVGVINVDRAAGFPTLDLEQRHRRSDGTGSLDDARGSVIVTMADGTQLTGDVTFTGSSWSGSSWTGSSWSGSSWSGSSWSGSSWSGSSWSGSSWSGSSWSGSSWSSSSWSGSSWTGSSWSGSSWSGSSWSGSSWSGASWS